MDCLHLKSFGEELEKRGFVGAAMHAGFAALDVADAAGEANKIKSGKAFQKPPIPKLRPMGAYKFDAGKYNKSRYARQAKAF